MYHQGEGVSQNYSKAIEYYRKAADKAYVKAMYNIGCMYYAGEGVAKNTEEALNWWYRAKIKGNLQAETAIKTHQENEEKAKREAELKAQKSRKETYFLAGIRQICIVCCH